MILFKSSFLTLILGISLSLFVNITNASNKDGPTAVGKTGSTGNPAVNNGADCNLCHGAPIPGIAPDVLIEGPKIVAADTKYTYKLSMTGGQKKIGGINVGVDTGVLFNGGLGKTAVDATTGEVKHIKAQTVMLDNTTITWLIDWVSPNVPGTSTIYASLLSADGDTKVGNDKSTKISYTIEVVDKAITEVPVIKNANVEISAPFNAQFGTQVQFFAVKKLNSPKGSFIKDFTWKTNINNTVVVKNGEQVEFSFDTIGGYTVYLNTTSDNGNVASTFFDINIVDFKSGAFVVPNAKITPPGSIVVGTEVTLSGVSSTPTTITQYYWDFGENNPDPVSNPSSEIKHTFTTIGKHIVTLAVQISDPKGGFADIDMIEVDVVAAPAGGGGGNQVTTGLSLYNSNCNSCHGASGIGGSAKNIQGATVVLIDRTLINGTHPAISITPANSVQLIATYLGSGADSLNGLSLFTNRCLLCHGVEGVGVAGLGKRVQGVSKLIIERAVNNQNPNSVPPPISLMKGVKLTTAEATLIESYLATVVPVASALIGKSLFISNCQMCHGTGEGGQAKTIIGFNDTLISNAISNIQSMNTAKLTSLLVIDKMDLAAYLAGPTLIPRPTTGPALFEMYCSYCHGADGTGAVIATKSIKAKKFDEKKIRDAYGENGIKLMRKSNIPNVNLTKIERQNIAIFLDPTVANGGN